MDPWDVPLPPSRSSSSSSLASSVHEVPPRKPPRNPYDGPMRQHLDQGAAWLKRQNPNIKHAQHMGELHPSSTAPEQGYVVDVRLSDHNRRPLGTTHFLPNGAIYGDKSFHRSLGRGSKDYRTTPLLPPRAERGNENAPPWPQYPAESMAPAGGYYDGPGPANGYGGATGGYDEGHGPANGYGGGGYYGGPGPANGYGGGGHYGGPGTANGYGGGGHYGGPGTANGYGGATGGYGGATGGYDGGHGPANGYGGGGRDPYGDW